ncbi:BLUF domain-containing protein [Curvivirga aplysinae]|uniref:BLUF domain-containing protein n=1 Tax=Curvivirga aplysinae TaxID=2529852 RepID=UPI0012BBE194|nr:BLUF domain-containing protein [Curvivirga aplysinae]MTI08887.1 BLUF domain-containing protein [Curvivirga aplysinae]
MLLTRLIYVSDLNADVSFEAEQMLSSARKLNKSNFVTGALWFTGAQFIQVLEGGRHAVSETYHRIAKDTRHQNIELVSCNTVDERIFQDWSMGFFGDTETNRAQVLKFSVTDSLQPERMTADSLLAALRSLELSE